MDNHLKISDVKFESLFERCALDPVLFTHEAHIRLAWIHVTKYGRDAAIKNVCRQLQAFVNHAGAKDKYNETLTVAAIKAVHHFIKKSTTGTFADFINEFPQLKYEFKRLMSLHYRMDIYNSIAAKKEFLEPDLLPFDV